MRRAIARLLLLFLPSAGAFAAGLPLAQVVERGALLVGPYAEVLEDRDRRLDIDAVSRAGGFVPAGAEMPNFGYSHSAWWLRFTLDPRGATGREWVLELRFPTLDEVDLYLPTPAGWQRLAAGDALPFAARPEPHQHWVFRLPALDQPQTYYLRIASKSVVTAPLRVWTPVAFAAHDRMSLLVHGLLYGLIGALLLYNLMLFLSLRERVYLWYVLYVASFGGFVLSFDGFPYQYLWPQNPWLQSVAVAACLALALGFAARFAAGFLDLGRRSPGADRALLAVAVLGFLLAGAAVSGLLGYGSVLRTLSFAAPVAVAITLWTALRALQAGYRPARFFLLAWAALFVFVVAGALRNFGLLPAGFLTLYGLHIGLALDVVLLSFALADRITLLKRGEARAQDEALAAQERLLAATRGHEAELERRIEARTAELNAANERLREEFARSESLIARLREQEERMRFMAQHDALTGLPNRLSMNERFSLAIEMARRGRRKVAVMLIDLDDFKRLNDTRGHAAGDHALVSVATRLRTAVRGSDTVARYGGDEFVVLAVDLERREDAVLIADKLADILSLPLPVEGGPWDLGASIGIAVFPDDATSPDDLLAAADRAMYAAKGAGKRRYAFAS